MKRLLNKTTNQNEKEWVLELINMMLCLRKHKRLRNKLGG